MLVPSGSFTERTMQVLEPSLAGHPLMINLLPTLNERLDQPSRRNELGAPLSQRHFTSAPSSSFESK